MTFPNDPLFWAKESAGLWATSAPLVIAALLAGAEGGASALPIEMSTLVNWELFNEGALQFLEQYRLSVIAGISETTRVQAISAINQWIVSGDPLSVLQARLVPLFGANRANMIAVTEVTRIFGAGNQLAWTSAGVVGGKKWQSAQDDIVTPICRALHGQTVPLTGNFVVPPGGSIELQRMVASNGNEFAFPPAHVNCRSWHLPVVSEELLGERLRLIFA